ncbi:unnamed protein product [Closterium sp. Yama58-4]|nr:unnamed protein product [Closterium sp. Yama58-4]
MSDPLLADLLSSTPGTSASLPADTSREIAALVAEMDERYSFARLLSATRPSLPDSSARATTVDHENDEDDDSDGDAEDELVIRLVDIDVVTTSIENKSVSDTTKLDIGQPENSGDVARSDGGQVLRGEVAASGAVGLGTDDDDGVAAASVKDGESREKEIVEDKKKRKAQGQADGEAAAKAGEVGEGGEAGETRGGKLARVAPVAEPEAPVAEARDGKPAPAAEPEAPVAEARDGKPAPAADPAAPWSVGHPEGHPRSPFLRLHQGKPPRPPHNDRTP